jgi:hypothetical protein
MPTCLAACLSETPDPTRARLLLLCRRQPPLRRGQLFTPGPQGHTVPLCQPAQRFGVDPELVRYLPERGICPQ